MRPAARGTRGHAGLVVGDVSAGGAVLRPGARARVAALRVAGRRGARGGLPRVCSVHGGPVQHQLPVPQLAGPRGVALRRVGDCQPPLPGGVLAPVVHGEEGPVVKRGRGPVLGPRQQQVRGCAARRGQGDLEVTARRKLEADPGLDMLQGGHAGGRVVAAVRDEGEAGLLPRPRPQLRPRGLQPRLADPLLGHEAPVGGAAHQLPRVQQPVAELVADCAAEAVSASPARPAEAGGCW